MPPPVDRLRLLEGVLLIAAAPIWLFPSLAPPAALGAVIVMLGLWLWQWRQGGAPILPSTPLTLTLWLWIAAVGIGVLVSAESDLTLPKATNLFLGLAAWRYLSLTITNRRSFLIALNAYLVIGAALILGGVLSADWSFKISWVRALVNLLPWQTLHLPGSPTPGVHTNQLAGTLVLYLPLALCLWLGWQPQRQRLFIRLLGLPVVALLLFLLIATQSRSGWLAALISLLILLAARVATIRRTVWRRAVWGLCLGLLLVVGLFLSQLGPGALSRMWTEPPRDTLVGSLTSLAFRQEVWRWAITATTDFPATGTGLGTFRRVVHRLYLTQIPVDYDFGHAHNMFLQVAVDTGLPGLVAYLALLGGAFLNGGWLIRHSPPWRPVTLGLTVGLVALHLYGLTDAIAPGAKNGLPFWLALALLGALRQPGVNGVSQTAPALRQSVRNNNWLNR